MTKGKKYDFQVSKGSTGWTAEIIRKKTSKETVVSKSRSGFSSEAEARDWGQRELETFVQALSERNKRQSKEKAEKSKTADKSDKTENSEQP